MKDQPEIFEKTDMRNRTMVFRNRSHAGMVIAEMMGKYREKEAIILAIPSGGIPVCEPMVRELNLPFDLAVASKITLPWSTESGYGAIAYDGTVMFNKPMVAHFELNEKIIEEGIKKTREKVERRMKTLRRNEPLPDIKGKTVILVDDGLASGITMKATLKAVSKSGAGNIIIAVPTAHMEALAGMKADAIYCPNIKKRMVFCSCRCL